MAELVPAPFADLVTRLSQSLIDQNADIAIASCPQGTHPTIGLWPVDLAERLEHDLMETNIRSVHQWLGTFRVALTEFPSDMLANVNTPVELAACQRGRRPDRAAGLI